MENLLPTFTPSYYRKVLEKALQWTKPNNEVINEVVFDIFPEIREYEHNRIKNEIINTLEYAQECGGILSKEKYNEYINWLEKQGDYNRLVEEIKERKKLLSKEKEKATSANDKLSLGGRIAILEELLAFTNKKLGEQKLVEEKVWSIYVPKDGDIVFAKAKIEGKSDFIRIFYDKDDEEGRSWSYCSLLYSQDEKKMYLLPSKGYISLYYYDIQKATEEQKNLLLNKIIEYGFYWNTTEKVLKRIKKY